MYTTVLVEKLIEDGARFLKQMDDRRIPVGAAAWSYDFDRETWTLVIVTSLASPSPREAYLRIQSAIAGLDLSFSLDDVMVMNPDSRKFADFKRRMEGVVSASDLQENSPVSFHDAYIYRWPD